MAGPHRCVLCDVLGVVVAQHGLAIANGPAVPRRPREAGYARDLEPHHRRAGEPTESHVGMGAAKLMRCTSRLVRDGRCPGRRCVPRRLCVRAGQCAARVALVETHQPAHAHAGQRRVVRHALRRRLRPPRVFGRSAVLARGVSPCHAPPRSHLTSFFVLRGQGVGDWIVRLVCGAHLSAGHLGAESVRAGVLYTRTMGRARRDRRRVMGRIYRRVAFVPVIPDDGRARHECVSPFFFVRWARARC